MLIKYIKAWNSIQGKIILFFVLSALFIAGVTWLSHNHFLLVSVEEDKEAYVMSLTEQIASSVVEDRETYENFLIQMSYNRELPLILSQTYGDDYNDVWEGVDRIGHMIDQQTRMALGIRNIEIFHTNNTFCEDGKYLFLISEEEIESHNSVEWNVTRDHTCEISRNISGMYEKRKACMHFLINMDYVFGNYMDESSVPGCRYYILDENRQYLAGSDKKDMLELTEKEFTSLKEGKVFKDKEREMMVTGVPAGASWYVIMEYPMSEYQSDKLRSGSMVFMILFIYYLIVGSVLFFFVKRIFTRLRNIGSSLEEIGKKDFRFLDYIYGDDEIARLEKQYNDMIEKLSDTIDEMAEMKNKKQKLEIRVLESQINPHFLYNTLGVMQWKAIATGNQELCEMIENLTIFYRRSMSGGGLVQVEKEINQIRAYMVIQQIRYDHCVECSINVDEEANEVLMPKMILQPLIENIYLHAGIVLEGHRKIGISVQKEEDILHIVVSDNGTGMGEDILYNVNHNINLSDDHGIGISFIYNSLETYYQDRGLLHFDSRPNEGTTATIKIPIISGKN